MKLCATCKQEKPEAAFHRKADAADGLHPHCKECKKLKDAAYRLENADRLREFDRARGQQPVRKAYQTARLKADYEANKPEKLAAMKRYHAEHPEAVREAKRAYKARNPAKVLSDTRRRQAGKLNATPAWANQFFIEEAYELARLRTQQKTGGFDEWQVDHIVPLQHPLVQGLHVEHNLQVIPAIHNQQKGNRTWPDMPATIIDPKGGSMRSTYPHSTHKEIL